MVKADLYVTNANIVTETAVLRGGVTVREGRIAQLLSGDEQVEAERVIDLQGMFLLPGIVDSHVHFNEPGRETWEGYLTGTMAAAAGGVTTVLEMPLNSTPPTTNTAALARKREIAARVAIVDYGHWGGFVDNNLADLPRLDREGVIGFKGFASNSGVDYERLDDDLIYAGLLSMREMGNLLGLHAENEYVTALLGKQLRAKGRTDRAGWCESRPPETELEAIQRACYWARLTGGNLHIVHVSTAEGIRAVTRARLEGAHATAETCPHYLVFDQTDFERIGPAAKCAPPIRLRKDVEALWDCVLRGMVDTIGSDHSPCAWAEKEKGMEDIWEAWGGVSGIQTMLPALLTEGVARRGLPLPALARVLAGNPARLFGLYPQKGAFLPGADADMVVVNLDKEWVLSADQLLYKNKHSAYVGCPFRGKVEQTFVRGQTVYLDGRITVEPGYGTLVKRQLRYAYP